jgi:hypothetical protein
LSVPQSTARLDLRVSKTCDPKPLQHNPWTFKTSLVRDHYRCFLCESFRGCHLQLNVQKVIYRPPQKDPGTLRLYVFARACPTSASCHHRLRNFPFFCFTPFPFLPFFFARSFVLGLGTRAPRSAVPKSLSVSQSVSASPGFFFTSQTIRFFWPFLRVQHGCRLRRLSRLGRCSTHCSKTQVLAVGYHCCKYLYTALVSRHATL